MLTAGVLDSAFRIYWDEMDRCRSGRTYWALLHVTVCLPDICSALQADTGRTTGALYAGWSERYLADALLSGNERYDMRCRVLHEGRTKISASVRYSGFSFSQPAATGEIDHRRLEGSTLVLEVGTLAQEVRHGVEEWIRHLIANPSSPEACNTERNLPSLVRVRQFTLPPKPGMPSISTPTIINRTS
jgi:hypothetical protein